MVRRRIRGRRQPTDATDAAVLVRPDREQRVFSIQAVKFRSQTKIELFIFLFIEITRTILPGASICQKAILTLGVPERMQMKPGLLPVAVAGIHGRKKSLCSIQFQPKQTKTLQIITFKKGADNFNDKFRDKEKKIATKWCLCF